MVQQIFLRKKVTNKQIPDSAISWSFDPENQLLTLYNKEQECFKCRAKAGQSFQISDYVNPPDATKVVLPERKTAVIKYLLSLTRCQLATSREEIESICWEFYPDEPQFTKSEHFELVVCGKGYRLWMNELITKKEVIELMQVYSKAFGIWKFPKHYVKAVLRARFGINGRDVEPMNFKLTDRFWKGEV